MQKPLTEIEMELAKERDILKKAAAYFARESLPGTRQ
jgi:transposase